MVNIPSKQTQLVDASGKPIDIKRPTLQPNITATESNVNNEQNTEVVNTNNTTPEEILAETERLVAAKQYQKAVNYIDNNLYNIIYSYKTANIIAAIYLEQGVSYQALNNPTKASRSFNDAIMYSSNTELKNKINKTVIDFNIKHPDNIIYEPPVITPESNSTKPSVSTVANTASENTPVEEEIKPKDVVQDIKGAAPLPPPIQSESGNVQETSEAIVEAPEDTEAAVIPEASTPVAEPVKKTSTATKAKITDEEKKAVAKLLTDNGHPTNPMNVNEYDDFNKGISIVTDDNEVIKVDNNYKGDVIKAVKSALKHEEDTGGLGYNIDNDGITDRDSNLNTDYSFDNLNKTDVFKLSGDEENQQILDDTKKAINQILPKGEFKVETYLNDDGAYDHTVSIVQPESTDPNTGATTPETKTILAEGNIQEIKELTTKVIAPILKDSGLSIENFSSFPNGTGNELVVDPNIPITIENKDAIDKVKEINGNLKTEKSKDKLTSTPQPNANANAQVKNPGLINKASQSLDDIKSNMIKKAKAVLKKRAETNDLDDGLDVSRIDPITGDEINRLAYSRSQIRQARRQGMITDKERTREQSKPATVKELKSYNLNGDRYKIQLADENNTSSEYVLVDTKSGVKRNITSKAMLAVNTKTNKLMVTDVEGLNTDYDENFLPISKTTVGDYVDDNQYLNTKANRTEDEKPTASTTKNVIEKTTALGEKLKKFTNDLETGDKIGLAAQLAPALYNIGKGLLDKAEVYNPIHNTHALSALNDMRQRRLSIDRTPGRLVSQAAMASMQNNTSGGGSKAANLANLAANSRRQEDELSIKEANANQMTLPGENANFANQVGAARQNALETSRNLNTQSDAVKSRSISTGLSQAANVGQHLSNITNQTKQNKMQIALAATKGYEYNWKTGKFDYIGVKPSDTKESDTKVDNNPPTLSGPSLGSTASTNISRVSGDSAGRRIAEGFSQFVPKQNINHSSIEEAAKSRLKNDYSFGKDFNVIDPIKLKTSNNNRYDFKMPSTLEYKHGGIVNHTNESNKSDIDIEIERLKKLRTRLKRLKQI